MSDLAAALMVAIRTHAAQVDKQGEPYLLHVLRVVEAVSDEAKVVAALHDVWEDGGLAVLEAHERTPFASDNAVQLCGLSLAELRAVELLTRVEGTVYADYIQAMVDGANTHPRGRALAREVKIADLRDHLGRMPDPKMTPFFKRDWRPLQRRYERALASLEGNQR